MPRQRRDDDLILRIARMRYDQRLPQNEIARALALSESTISRALKAAMDLGFVEIQISASGRRDFALERRLVNSFGLDLAVVVQARADDAASYAMLGRAVARIVEEKVESGMVIGVSDGDTVAAIAAAIRRGRTADIDVVSLIGGVGAPQVKSHSSDICRAMASGLGARAWHLPVPAIVDHAEAAAALRAQSSVHAVFALMARTGLALVGVGAISPRATVFRHGVLGPDALAGVAAAGAAGTICGRFFGRRGEPIATPFDERTLAIPLSELRAVPLRIGVAVGSGKAASLRAAAGTILNGLALDAQTAEALLSMA